MVNNLKDTYAIKIRPDFDKKNIEKFKKDVSNSKVGIMGNVFKSTTSKVVGLIGAMSIMGLAVSSIRKSFDEANKGFQEFLDTTDRLSTLAGDLPNTTSGQLAFVDASLEESGIKTPEERDKIYRNLQDKIASGDINNPNNLSTKDIIASLQTQWQQARESGNTEAMSKIENIIGLRGKKASEFLQGNIKESIEERKARTGITEEQVTKNIEQGGVLEGEQAKNQSDEDVRRLVKTGETLDKNNLGNSILKSQAQIEKNKTDLLQEQLKVYEDSLKAVKTLDSSLNLLANSINRLITEGKTLADKILKLFGIEEKPKPKTFNSNSNTFSKNSQNNRESFKNVFSNLFTNDSKQTKK
jgi:hypothetical protein